MYFSYCSPIITNENSFIEYIKDVMIKSKGFRVTSREVFDYSRCVDVSYCVEKIYRENKHMAFVRVLRKCPTVMYKQNLDIFIKTHDKLVFSSKNTMYDDELLFLPTASQELLNSLYKRIGVYKLNKIGKTVYIGQSKNLRNRLYESLRNNFDNDCGGITIELLFTQTVADAFKWETYFIKKFRPINNIANNMGHVPFVFQQDEPSFAPPFEFDANYFMRHLLGN